MDGIPAPNPSYEIPVKNVTGDVNVKIQNKNLLPNNGTSQTINGITFTVNEDGSVLVNGTATAFTGFVLATHLKLDLGTFTLSGCPTGGSLETYYLSLALLGSFTFYVDVGNSHTKTYTQFNYDNTNVTARINITSGTTVNNLLFKPQFEQGGAATTYVPHQEQNLPLTLGDIELCKIETAQDYFIKENGKWYLHKETGKVVFDGSNEEIWVISSTNTSGYNRFTSSNIYNLIKKPTTSSEIMNIYSNYFIKKSADNTYARIDGISVGTNGNLYIYSDELKEYTAEQFKTWLSTHNTEVYYVLETPTNTEITDTTLINQLEAISKAKAYKEVTYIEATSSDLEPIIKVQYWESEE